MQLFRGIDFGIVPSVVFLFLLFQVLNIDFQLWEIPDFGTLFEMK
jgi:hypothetical protein